MYTDHKKFHDTKRIVDFSNDQMIIYNLNERMIEIYTCTIETFICLVILTLMKSEK